MAKEYYKIATEQGYSVDVSKHMNKGWELFKANAGEFVGFALVTLIIYLVSTIIPVLGSIAVLPLIPGIAIVGHKLDKGRPHSFSAFFDGYQKFVEIFLMNLLLYVLIMCVMSPVLIFIFVFMGADFGNLSPESEAGILGTLFLIVVPITIYFTVCWVWSVMFILFHDMKAWEALEASRKLVNKNWLGTFALVFSIGFVTVLVGILTLTLGLLFLIPWAYLVLYSAFEDITKFDDETQKDDLFEHFVS